MKKSLLLALWGVIMMAFGANAQMFTSSPTPLQESSKNVVITYHGDVADGRGTPFKGTTADLYAHIGVYTNKSPNSWSHVASGWGENVAKCLLKYKSTNTWELNVGDLRTYFGITDASEHITKVCILARNAAANSQTDDYFIDVVPEGFAMSFTNNASSMVLTKSTTITFNVGTTQSSTITLSVNGSQVAQGTGTSLSKAVAFSQVGEYTIEAKAVSGGQTLTETAHVLYVAPSPSVNYPGGTPKMGAVENADGSVTFCLAAPGKSVVTLVGSWDNYEMLSKNTMNKHVYGGNEYFWITVKGLDPNKYYAYYYNVDGTKDVGDPCAKTVLDPNYDKWLNLEQTMPYLPVYPEKVKSMVPMAIYYGKHDSYDWKVKNFNIPRVEDLVIYELLIRDFTGTNGQANGEGTIRKMIDKFDYLKNLGVNAIELMPVMEFNGNDSWGYNTNFYMALDKAYGSPDDLREFIDLCHENGIAVLLDIVFNQSEWLHPWYQMYGSASASPFYNGTAPHDYSVLNDWKQENVVLQQHWADVLAYWINAYKVDGYRFDLTKGLGEGATSSLYGSTNGYNAKRIKVLERLGKAVKAANPNAIHINEHLGDKDEENEFAAMGQYNWNNQSWNSTLYAVGATDFDFDNIKYFSSGDCGRKVGSLISYAESHDEERLGFSQLNHSKASLKGTQNHGARMKRLGSVAAWLMFTPDATPMVWQFGELGADETTKKSDGGNDTGRKKVIWHYLDDADRAALHDNYAALINLRVANPDLFKKANYSNNLGTNGTARYVRFKKGDQDVICVINTSINTSMSVTPGNYVTNAADYELVTASKGYTTKLSNRAVTLPANSFVVYKSPSVKSSGIEDVTIDGNGSNYSINIEGGNITVTGDYKKVTVCDLMGRTVGQSGLSSGIYVVNVDGKAVKVLVK